MKSKLKKYLTWCAAAKNAYAKKYQARAALYKEYDFDEWLKSDDITRKDCIVCSGAMLPMVGRPTGEDLRYYKHCKFYKADAFCGVADGGCDNRAKNLHYADMIARYDLARTHRQASFKALFHLKWFDLWREYFRLQKKIEILDARSTAKFHAWQEQKCPYSEFQQVDALYKEAMMQSKALKNKLLWRNK
jgi:hypothetical protein